MYPESRDYRQDLSRYIPMGSLAAKDDSERTSMGNFSYSAGKMISSPRQEVSSRTTDIIMNFEF